MIRKYTLRVGIVLLWIGLIATALYWPTWEIFPYKKNTLNVFAWGDILEPSLIADFEKETGIKINLSFYSSNEELLVKLKATGGKGYDLIIPSDYAVNLLIEKGLLKELDKKKLPFWNQINKHLLGHFFDPENTYSIPFEWELYGFGIDKEYFKDKPFDASWKMLFDPQSYKVTMTNDPIEAVEFASFYLYGTSKSITSEQGIGIKNLLMKQNKWVEAYADSRGDYFLATKNCALVVASSSYIWRSMRLFDFIGFVVPKEGTFITIENLCIPKASNNDQLVYQLINYLYRPESVAKHFEVFGFFPATLNALDIAHVDPVTAELLLNAETNFDKYAFFQDSLPQQEVRDIWVEVKSGQSNTDP